MVRYTVFLEILTGVQFAPKLIKVSTVLCTEYVAVVVELTCQPRLWELSYVEGKLSITAAAPVKLCKENPGPTASPA